MFTDEEIAQVRELSESFMADECIVFSASSERVLGVDNIHASPETTVIYTGKCRVSPTTPATGEFGQELVDMRDTEIFVPATAVGIQPDHYLRLTSSQDPDNLNQVFMITNVQSATWKASVKLLAVSR
jgi:hypothetical protein